MPSGKLKNVAPTFLVGDVGTTAEWYEKQLGFTASFAPKEPPYVYASLSRDYVEIMLLRLEGYRKPVVERPTGHWNAYIRMEGVRKFYDALDRPLPSNGAGKTAWPQPYRCMNNLFRTSRSGGGPR